MRDRNFSYTCVTWLIRTSWLICMYVWYDSFMQQQCASVSWRICVCVWHDPCAPRDAFAHVCGMTQSRSGSAHVWHDSFMCQTWLIYMCGMTQSYVWHDSLICEIWSMTICGLLTHSALYMYMFDHEQEEAALADVSAQVLIYSCVLTSHTHMHPLQTSTKLTHMHAHAYRYLFQFYVWHVSCICVTRRTSQVFSLTKYVLSRIPWRSHAGSSVVHLWNAFCHTFYLWNAFCHTFHWWNAFCHTFHWWNAFCHTFHLMCDKTHSMSETLRAWRSHAGNSAIVCSLPCAYCILMARFTCVTWRISRCDMTQMLCQCETHSHTCIHVTCRAIFVCVCHG